MSAAVAPDPVRRRKNANDGVLSGVGEVDAAGAADADASHGSSSSTAMRWRRLLLRFRDNHGQSSPRNVALVLVPVLLSVAAIVTIGMTDHNARRANNDVYDEARGMPLSWQQQPLQPLQQCRIYMAPSSVKGLKGFGMFTTEPIRRNDFLLRAVSDGPSIPVVDYERFTNNETHQLRLARKAFVLVFNSYWWGHGVSHDTMSDRMLDPGAGAYSYYHGRDFFAMRDLDAGDEIFLNYGHCRDSPDQPSWAKFIPQSRDFDSAAKTTQRLWQLATEHSTKPDAVVPSSPRKRAKLYAKLVETAAKTTDGKLTDKGRALLPPTWDDLNQIMTRMSERDRAYSDAVARHLAKYVGSTPRTPDWVRQHGMCLETLKAGKSTLPQAGRGAFAQFPVAQGALVVPAPLLQIVDRDALVIPPEEEESGLAGPPRTQLLMNYCFGHPESSLLLCPNTNAILINHCSVRDGGCGPDGPNAKVRWALRWDQDTNGWLQMSLDEMVQQGRRGLSFEVVATRYIRPGEEVFIDYGAGWEAAWAAHVENWTPPRPDSGFGPRPSIAEMNRHPGPLRWLVSGDLRKMASDDTAYTGCVYWTTRDDNHKIYHRENEDWSESSDAEILKTYSDVGEEFVGKYKTHGEETYWPCSVLQQEDAKGDWYTVRIHQNRNMDRQPWHENGVPRLLTRFPRESIRYFYRPYTSDQHLPGAFRHYIEIPDDMFPEQWKNRKRLTESESRSQRAVPWIEFG